MAFGASAKNTESYPPVSVGIHPGVCYSVVDLGSSFSEKYQKWNRQIIISWEIQDEWIDVPDEAGNKVERRRVVSKIYSSTISKKARLREDLCSWRGKDFTPDEEELFEYHKLIGVPCQLNITHKKSTDGSTTYANVQTVIPKNKQFAYMELENPTVLYCIDEQGTAIPESVPEWVQKMIKASREYQVLVGNDDRGVSQAEEPVYADDDIPF